MIKAVYKIPQMRTEFFIISDLTNPFEPVSETVRPLFHLMYCLGCKKHNIPMIVPEWRQEHIKESCFLHAIERDIPEGLRAWTPQKLALLSINLTKDRESSDEQKNLGYLPKEDIIEVVV